jgi:hypothetical protein
MSEELNAVTNMGDQTSQIAEDKIASLFQPDTLISTQYFENLRRKTHIQPEKRLMLAVLRDAVSSYRDNLSARSAKKKRLFDETEEWISETGGDWIFSFDSVCESLGLNPAYVRQGLLRWKERSRAERRRIDIVVSEAGLAIERRRKVG